MHIDLHALHQLSLRGVCRAHQNTKNTKIQKYKKWKIQKQSTTCAKEPQSTERKHPLKQAWAVAWVCANQFINVFFPALEPAVLMGVVILQKLFNLLFNISFVCIRVLCFCHKLFFIFVHSLYIFGLHEWDGPRTCDQHDAEHCDVHGIKIKITVTTTTSKNVSRTSVFALPIILCSIFSAWATRPLRLGWCFFNITQLKTSDGNIHK